MKLPRKSRVDIVRGILTDMADSLARSYDLSQETIACILQEIAVDLLN